MTTSTLFLLMAQHQGKAVIPLGEVAKTHFEMSEEVFSRKVREGAIVLPVIEMDDSRKSAKGVHVHDLATYIDARRAEAIKMVS